MRAMLVVAAVITAMVTAAPAALAHGGVVGEDLRIAASLGERELTVIVRRVPAVPGPLRVDVVNHAGGRGGTLRIGAAVRGADPAGNATELRLADGGGLTGATLAVDRVGAWELWVDDGSERARIPFVVPADLTPVWAQVTTGGYPVAGALLLAALATAVFGRRSWPAPVLAACAATAAVVATTAALLSPGLPAGPEIDPLTGLPLADRAADVAAPPHVNLLAAANLTEGERSPIDLRLVDGATGRPVDDLAVHHEALLHLVAIGPGGQFAHLHPVRIGPGVYRVWFRPSSGGEHRLHAELERWGGGVQLVSATLPVTGAWAPEPAPGGLGELAAGGGLTARIAASSLVAGEPSVLAIELTEAGRPVEDLQPWLGMAGHLITVGPGGHLGHVHAMPAGQQSGAIPDETVARGGPLVEFVHTFATPGRHRLWFQVQRDFRLITVPVQIDVTAAPGTEAGS